MPHLVANRPRVSNLVRRDPGDTGHRRWNTINALTYKAGGLTFVAGSIFFFPALSAYESVGDWLFFIGSLFYLLVTGHDLLEVVKYWHHHPTHTFAGRIEYIAGVAYVFGTLLFVFGSLFFLPDWGWVMPGAWCFVIGSALFLVGGGVNLLQAAEAPSLIYLQLFNLTVATFLVGSALFVVASVPYLWHLDDAPNQALIYNFVAWQFLTGSALFLIGGICIFYRNLVQHNLEKRYHGSRFGMSFIHELRAEIKERGKLHGND